jgi:small redox-active disulfide protein 2
MTNMTQDDHSRIQVGEHQIGILGLKAAIAEIAECHRDRTDEEVEKELLERLVKKNYIPLSVREAYGKAFVREFRKSLGQPYEPEVSPVLDVVILGPGCYQCNRLTETVMQVLSETGTPASLEHVTDCKAIAEYGFVRTPALIVNGKVAAMGTVPSAKKIKDLLTSAQD